MRKHKRRYKTFTKQDLLFIKKFPRLFAICNLNNISYAFVNRCFKRYKTMISDEYYMSNLQANGYKRYWFGNDKDTFQTAISVYISNRMNGVKYYFKRYTHGDVSFQIAKMSEFEKYFKLEDKHIFNPNDFILHNVSDVKITNIETGEVFLSMDFASEATKHF